MKCHGLRNKVLDLAHSPLKEFSRTNLMKRFRSGSRPDDSASLSSSTSKSRYFANRGELVRKLHLSEGSTYPREILVKQPRRDGNKASIILLSLEHIAKLATYVPLL
jgi:hypothetical protein